MQQLQKVLLLLSYVRALWRTESFFSHVFKQIIILFKIHILYTVVYYIQMKYIMILFMYINNEIAFNCAFLCCFGYYYLHKIT